MNKTGLFTTADGKNYVVTFCLVCTLFFLWGYCNGQLDILNKHFKESFNTSSVASNLVQFSNYIGYFLMALPAGFIARQLGYKGGIITGLLLVALGAFWFIPATAMNQYWGYLLGLFIVAMGLACLETIANPYTTVLGLPETAATRINLAQICNAIGTALAPYISGLIILSATSKANTSNSTLYIPYMIIGSLVIVILIAFVFAKVPDVGAEGIKAGKFVETLPETKTVVVGKANETFILINLCMAVLAQFFYVAAQVGLNAYIMPFANSTDMPPLTESVAHNLPSNMTALSGSGTLYQFTEQGASFITTCALVLFLVGRISGTVFISRLSAHTTLAIFGGANVVLMLLTVLPLGWVSFFSLMIGFFFMSIMFPTIFALGIRGLGEYTKLGSSLIVMAIVGGALLPFLMGKITDVYSVRYSFIVPMLCFAFVMVYALMFPWLQRKATGHEVID